MSNRKIVIRVTKHKKKLKSRRKRRSAKCVDVKFRWPKFVCTKLGALAVTFSVKGAARLYPKQTRTSMK